MELFSILKAKAGIPVDDVMARLYAGRRKTPAVELMPHMDGVTNYYDCTLGLTSGSWKNQVQGGNDAVLTGVTVADDGAAQILCTSDSCGYFESGNAPGDSVCVYAVFKSPPITGSLPYANRFVIGSYDRNSSSTCFSFAIDGWSYDNTVMADFHGTGAGTNYSATNYRVLVANKNMNASSSNVSFYVDSGASAASIFTDTYDTGYKWGLGYLCYNDGNKDFGAQNHAVQIRFLAVTNQSHSAEQIAENMAWIREHFGMDG